ncbi:hypothetical protein H4S08_003117 [Coemansia sp. RSA 1365]|nr:hypothetical protein H4S08_003117 [Coemansia sp. RSA 1365]
MVEYTKKDVELMRKAIECGMKCTSVESAYNVGAVIVDKNGNVISTGYSRQYPGNTHAEQCALMSLKDNPNKMLLSEAYMYTTMEPCSKRLSGNVPCLTRILESGIKKVYFGVKEPPNFVNCSGIEQLVKHGVQAVHIKELEDECRQLNRHLSA